MLQSNQTPSLSTAITALGRPASQLETDEKAICYLKERGISEKITTYMRVHTGKKLHGGAIRPDAEGDVLTFPYFNSGKVEACKYMRRDVEGGWHRWLAKGCPLIFYGLDNLKKMSKKHTLVITEGEIDCLSAMQAGFQALSVPNGAPPPDKDRPVDYDPPPEDDDGAQFSYLRDCIEQIVSFEHVVIATDGDSPGIRLREELARRIGRAGNSYVIYPEGTKDLNEVLIRHGVDRVQEIIEKAPDFPLRGLHRFSEYADQEDIVGLSTGIPKLDDNFRPYLGSLCVVTGVPGHGKSTFVMDLAVTMAKKHNWKIAIWSHEMMAKSVFMSMVSSYANKPTTLGSGSDRAYAEEWVEDNVTVIDGGKFDEKITVKWMCQRMVEAVRRDGIRIVVLDPWGDMDHMYTRDGGINTEYVGESLKKIRRVATDLGLFIILIAHPRKMAQREDGSYVPPTAYHISGSSHFFNKVDFSVTIYRPPDIEGTIDVIVEKVRYQPATGEPGSLSLNYSRDTGKFW